MRFDVPEHWAWDDAMNHEIVVKTEARGYPEYPSRFVSVPESNGLSYVSIFFVSLPLRDLVEAHVVTLAQMGVDYELRVGEIDGDQVFFVQVDRRTQREIQVYIESSYRETWEFSCVAELGKPEVLTACEDMVETIRFD